MNVSRSTGGGVNCWGCSTERRALGATSCCALLPPDIVYHYSASAERTREQKMLFSRKVVRGLISTTVAAAALAVPAMSSADTPVPPLQAGDTQAYASLTSGGPVITSPIVRQYSGSITMNYTPNDNTCNAVLTSTINPDGTMAVTQATLTPVYCGSANVPGSYATMTAPAG